MGPEQAAKRSSIKVGLLLFAALGALMASILLIGEKNNLFRPMNRYSVKFPDVSGLQEGNPVQLNGVAVGRVTRIVLPEDPGQHDLTVWIGVDRRFAKRVRKDSQARIQTLGLLGDKYIELSSGTDDALVIPNRGEVATAPATDVDKLINSGEDAVQNIVAISSSLVRLLERIEKGDSVIGELLAPLPEGSDREPLVERIHRTMDSLDTLMAGIQNGGGPLGRLLFDREAGDRLSRSIEHFESLMVDAREGEGLLPALLHDSALKNDTQAVLSDLRATSGQLRDLVQSIEQADGLLPRLLEDEAFADEVVGKVQTVLDRLDGLSSDLVEGDGTVSRLIRDPEVYEALNDVIVGVNESRLLRWLIRNRQKAGIEKRYRETRATSEPADSDSGANDSEPEGSSPE